MIKSGGNSLLRQGGNSCLFSLSANIIRAVRRLLRTWGLRDSAGTSFQVVNTAYGEMPVDCVEAGATSGGELVYKVPVSTHQFILTFAPTTGGGQNVWDIPV